MALLLFSSVATNGAEVAKNGVLGEVSVYGGIKNRNMSLDCQTDFV
jgi:hypothetical protein